MHPALLNCHVFIVGGRAAELSAHASAANNQTACYLKFLSLEQMNCAIQRETLVYVWQSFCQSFEEVAEGAACLGSIE